MPNFSHYSLRNSSRRMYWLVMHQTARQTVIELSLVMLWWAQSTTEPSIVPSYSRYMRLMKIWTGIWARYVMFLIQCFEWNHLEQFPLQKRCFYLWYSKFEFLYWWIMLWSNQLGSELPAFMGSYAYWIDAN